MRWLLLADLVVTALSGTVLLSSPTAFAYYRLGWLAHIGIALLVFLLARRHAYGQLIGLSIITLPIALLMLPAHFGALDLLLILWTLGALPLFSAGLIGRESAPRTLLPPRLLLIVVIAAGCVVSLRSIHDFPNFSATDEAMIYNYVDTFERTGKIEASLIPYPAPVVTGNLYIYGAELWTTLFRGDPFALRNFSALGGFLLIAVVFVTGRALRDALTGWIAATLLATNLLWMAVSHVGRQEIWLAVFVWTAVWLSLEARKRTSLVIAALAGVIIALSADVHPLGALACVALGGWWITSTWRWKSKARHERISEFAVFTKPTSPPPPLHCVARGEKRARRASPLHSLIASGFGCANDTVRNWVQPSAPLQRTERRILFAFILGGLIGTAYYVYVHILPDPGYFLAGVREELFSYGAEGSNPLSAMIVRHANYQMSNPLEVGLLLVYGLWALRQREGQRLGIFVGGLMLLYALTVADPNMYYPMVWITGMVILAAVGIQTVSWNWRAPLQVAFLASFVLNAVLIDHQVSAGWNERALSAIQQVAAQLPNGERGSAESFVYLALRDPRFIGFTFVNIWARDAGISRWEITERLKPDWIVTVRDESLFVPPFGVLSVDVPNMHLEIPDAALAQEYYLSDSIATSVGDFEIWRRS